MKTCLFLLFLWFQLPHGYRESVWSHANIPYVLHPHTSTLLLMFVSSVFQFTDKFPQVFRPELWLKNAHEPQGEKCIWDTASSDLAAAIVFSLTTSVPLRLGQNSSSGQFRLWENKTTRSETSNETRRKGLKILLTLWESNKNICVSASLVPTQYLSVLLLSLSQEGGKKVKVWTS